MSHSDLQQQVINSTYPSSRACDQFHLHLPILSFLSSNHSLTYCSTSLPSSHLSIFGRTPTPPPPTGDSTASAADPTPSSGPPTPQVPGGFKEDSKQLGHEVTSEPTSVPNAGNVSTLPTTHLEESREVGKGLNSALPPVQEPIQKDPGLESSNPPGYVNKLEEEKTPIPFGEKGIDFSTPAEKDSLSTEDPIGIPSGYKASEMLDESNSPGYGAQAGTSFQDSAMRSGGEIGESRDLAQSAPPMHSAFGGDHQEQQLPLDSKNEKALASNFGEMSMEEKRVADKQPLVDDRGGREEKGLGGAPPIDQTRSQDDQLGHSGGPAGAGAEGLAGTGGHDVKAHQRDDHLNPNVGAVKTGHSPASSTKTSITNGGEEERSVDEAGNKKPKKKVGLGDK